MYILLVTYKRCFR